MEHTTVKHLLGLLSERIRIRRRLLGLTQEQLGELSDLSPNYIARIELGTKTPSVATLFKIASALRMNPADLINEVPAEVSCIEQIAHALNGLDSSETDFIVNQVREISSFIRKHRDDHGND